MKKLLPLFILLLVIPVHSQLIDVGRATLQKERSELQEKREDLLSKSAPDTAEVKKIEVRIAEIEKELSAAASDQNYKEPPPLVPGGTGNLLIDLEIAEGMIASCEAISPSACKKYASDIGEYYFQISKSPAMLEALSRRAISRFERMRSQTKSAMQVSQITDEQNAVLMRIIVAQNQRIIELLDQIAKKK
jgi:hypothetical protein